MIQAAYNVTTMSNAVTTEQLALLVTFGSFAVAFVAMLRNSSKDAAADKAFMAKMSAQLDAIEVTVQEIKAEMHAAEKEAEETRAIALYARDRAEAAHNRLDRAGVDTHPPNA